MCAPSPYMSAAKCSPRYISGAGAEPAYCAPKKRTDARHAPVTAQGPYSLAAPQTDSTACCCPCRLAGAVRERQADAVRGLLERLGPVPPADLDACALRARHEPPQEEPPVDDAAAEAGRRPCAPRRAVHAEQPVVLRYSRVDVERVQRVAAQRLGEAGDLGQHARAGALQSVGGSKWAVGVETSVSGTYARPRPPSGATSARS